MDRLDTTLKNLLAITVGCAAPSSVAPLAKTFVMSRLCFTKLAKLPGRQTSVQWDSACGWSDGGTPVEGESRPAGCYIICLPGGGSGVRFGLGIVSSNLGIVGRGKLHIRPEMVCYGILAM